MSKNNSFFEALMKSKEGFAKLNLNANRIYNLSVAPTNNKERWSTFGAASDLAIAYGDTFEPTEVQVIHSVEVINESILSASFKPIALSGLGTSPPPVKLKASAVTDFPSMRVPKLVALKNLASFDDLTPATVNSDSDEDSIEITVPDMTLIPPCLTKIIGTEKMKKGKTLR